MSEVASPAQANLIRPRETSSSGHSSEGAEACHRCGSNEHMHAFGLLGVIGEGARRQTSRGSWETRRRVRATAQRHGGIHNRMTALAGSRTGS